VTLGVTAVGEDKWLQELFCHCCGVQVADVGGVADIATFTREDDLPDTRDCSAVKAHRTRLQRCEQGGAGRESPARCGITETRNLSVCSRVGAARGLTPGNGDHMLPNHNTSTVGEITGASRFLSSIEADGHPTVVIARGHDGALLRERAVVGVRHVEKETAAGESPLGLSQFRGIYGADVESGGGEAFTGPGEGGPDEDGVSDQNHVGGTGF